MQIHCAAVVLVILLGCLLHISKAEWIVCLILFGMVMGLECVNTAVEAVVDLVTKERRPLAKKAKDAAAGAVLIAAIFAVAIGVVLFWNIEKFAEIAVFFSEPLRLILLIIGILIEAAFVFLPRKKTE